MMRFTVMGCHRLPCGVWMPRSFKAADRPVSVDTPLACSYDAV